MQFSSFHSLAGCRTGFRLLLMGGSLLGLLACTLGPVPLTPKELTALLQEDQKELFAEQEPVQKPLDLHEAVARALKYNLDYRVNLLEKTVALTEMDLSRYDLLPRMAARAGFDSRNTVEASSGLSLATGVTSTGYSTAQDREKRTADLNVVWNVLDFGVSYFQAKQAADRILVAEENRRKLAHNQVQEVQAAFWRAASAQQLQSRIEPVLQEARAALEVAHQVEKERLRPQLEMMRFQRELLDVVQQMETLREELDLAKKNLALLINLPPGTDFTLKIPDASCLTVTPIRVTLPEMEQLALMNRPELRMEMYKSRISADETRKALLRLLPGLEFKSGSHYDSNSYLLDARWQDAGLQVTGNLMKLVSGPTALRLADNQVLLGQVRRMALNMAVLSQVHIGYRKYLDAVRKFESYTKISEVDQRILENVRLDAGSIGQNRLEQIRAATRAIMSQLQRNKSYAEVQNAIGLIFVSLGVDLLPSATPEDALPALSQAVREAMLAWQEGISLPPRGAGTVDGFDEEEIDRPEDPAVLREINTLLLESAREGSPLPAAPPASQEERVRWLFPDRSPVPAAPPPEVSRLPTGVAGAARQEPLSPGETVVPPRETGRPAPPIHPAANEKKTVAAPEAAAPGPEEEGGETPATPVGSGSSASRASAPEPPAVPPVPTEESLRILVKEWVDAWARQDTQTFLAFYSENFLPENNWDRVKWQEAYTTLLNPATRVRVTLGDLGVEVESEAQAAVYVRLEFASAGDKWEKRKTLQLRKEQKQWRIVTEKTDNRPAISPDSSRGAGRKQ